MNHLRNKIKALEKAIHALKPYIGHAQGCSYSNYVWGGVETDFCTCNLKSAIKEIQKALAIKA